MRLKHGVGLNRVRCETYKHLYEAIAERTSTSGGVAVIDGASGSGKSTVATQLAHDLNGIQVSADRYVDASRSGPYVDLLALERIGDDIRRLQGCYRVVLFEGICARDILNKLGITPWMSIYVQVMAASGLWHLEFHLEDFANGSEEVEEPIRSDYEYHTRVRPHESADVTYVRVVD